MPQPSESSFVGAAARALIHPLPIVLAVGTVVSAMAAPILVMPGAIAWLLSVIVIAGMRSVRGRGPEVDVGALPPSIRAALAGVDEAIDELQRAIGSVPAEQMPMFEGVRQDAEQVRSAVWRLASSAGALHRHLASNRPEDLQSEIDGLRARLDGTEDPGARADLESALERAEARVQRREAQMVTLERYRATLRDLQTSAQEMADRAVNLAAGESLEARQYDEESPVHRMTELKAGVAALEEVMGSDAM